MGILCSSNIGVADDPKIAENKHNNTPFQPHQTYLNYVAIFTGGAKHTTLVVVNKPTLAFFSKKSEGKK